VTEKKSFCFNPKVYNIMMLCTEGITLTDESKVRKLQVATLLNSFLLHLCHSKLVRLSSSANNHAEEHDVHHLGQSLHLHFSSSQISTSVGTRLSSKAASIDRSQCPSALFTFLVGWHATAVSLPPSDVIFGPASLPQERHHFFCLH
jgi:hypothetical protein